MKKCLFAVFGCFVLLFLTVVYVYGDTVFVAGADTNVVEEYSGGTGNVFGAVNASSVSFLTLAANKFVYASSSSGDIFRFYNGGESTVFAKRLNNPRGLVATNNCLYVADNNGQIFEINSLGEKTLFATTPTGYLQGLAYNNGYLYAASTSNVIYKVSLSSGTVSVFATNTLFNDGHLYWPASLLGPLGIAFDSSNNLYVANNSSDYITKFNSLGQPIADVQLDSGSPRGLAIAGNTLYVTSTGPSGHGIIYDYNVNDFQYSIPFADTGSYQPYGIVAQVPEMSVWIFVVIGICFSFGLNKLFSH